MARFDQRQRIVTAQRSFFPERDSIILEADPVRPAEGEIRSQRLVHRSQLRVLGAELFAPIPLLGRIRVGDQGSVNRKQPCKSPAANPCQLLPLGQRVYLRLSANRAELQGARVRAGPDYEGEPGASDRHDPYLRNVPGPPGGRVDEGRSEQNGDHAGDGDGSAGA